MAAAAILGGCSAPPPEIKLTVSEAQKAFESKCLKDFNMHVRTRQVGETFWIYLPVKDPIFDYEVQKSQTSASSSTPPSGPKYILNYTDGKFADRTFSFDYDVVEQKKSKDENYGFNSSYTDSYVKNQNNLFTAIYEVFFNTKPAGKEIMPKFFVLIITDIKKGIETRATFYLEDFVKYMSGALPYDEYIKRFLADRKGSTAIIGDETGSHIKYKNISMPEFLADQIVNRIQFKFQYSDFPPGEDYDKAVADIVADTLRYYDFKDFASVKLNNIRLGKNYVFGSAKLKEYGEDKPQEPKGRLINIRFMDGKAEFEELPPSGQKHESSPEQKPQSP